VRREGEGGQHRKTNTKKGTNNVRKGGALGLHNPHTTKKSGGVKEEEKKEPKSNIEKTKGETARTRVECSLAVT